MTEPKSLPRPKRYGGRIVVAILAVLFFLYAGRNCLAELHRIADARLSAVAAIAAIHLLTLWLTGLTFKIGLAAYHEPISVSDGFKMSTLASYSNLLLPRAGLGLVAAYLKRTRNVSLTHFGCVILFNAAIFVSSVSIVGLVALTLQPSLAGEFVEWVAISLAVLTVASLGATRIRLRIPDRYQGRLFSLARKFADASQKIGAGKYLVRLWITHTGLTLLRIVRLICAFWALSLPIKPLGIAAASLLGDLALLVSVTPSGLGFREAAVASIASSMKITASIAVSVALLDRLIFSLTNVFAAQAILANRWWREIRSPAILPDASANGATPQSSLQPTIGFIATREPSYSRVSIVRDQLKRVYNVDEYVSTQSKYGLRFLSVASQVLWAKLTGKLAQADLLFVGFFAQPIFPLIRLLYRGPIATDAYFSIYDTMVHDKSKASADSWLGRVCFFLDQTMLRSSSICFTDTQAHVAYMKQTFSVPETCIERLWISADSQRLPHRLSNADPNRTFEVFFWGGFIPLQGVDTIVRAAKLLTNENIRFTLYGHGQTWQQSKQLAEELRLERIHFAGWKSPSDILAQAQKSHIALGIFGTTDKAARVIPNKAYEAMAMGLPLITRRSPAIDELLEDSIECLLVEAGDPTDLAKHILWARDHYEAMLEMAEVAAEHFSVRCSPIAVGEILEAKLRELIDPQPSVASPVEIDEPAAVRPPREEVRS